MKIRKRFFISFFLTICSGIVFSQEKIRTEAVSSNKKTYSNIDHLNCGDTSISIASQCISSDGDDYSLHCFSQTVSVLNKKKNPIKNYYYSHENSGSSAFIYGAACLQNKNSYYLSLNSSNLGNCKNCEWYDFFSENGFYIGSSPWMNSKTSFTRKPLSSKDKNDLLNAKHINSIDITPLRH